MSSTDDIAPMRAGASEPAVETRTEGGAFAPVGARKHVTVLFSDLTGYTALSEQLDPEDVQEIMSEIFGEATRIVTKYAGHVDKLMGDAFMALFGMTQAHEDDPIRAVKTAAEIRDFVARLSESVEQKIGRDIAMHSGIATGLVVTAELDHAKGTERVLGDTVNLASRLTSLASAGEVVVSEATYRSAESHFVFEAGEPTLVKGKAEPVMPYRLLSARAQPGRLHRLSGLRADLVGRATEMARLTQAVERLNEQRGGIIAVIGEAGSGKSRLVDQLRQSVVGDSIRWCEGACYAYAQNTPYAPFLDLLREAWGVRETDSEAVTREKVEDGVRSSAGDADVLAAIESLFGLQGSGAEQGDAEAWRTRTRDALAATLRGLAVPASVICLHDLHWIDPSSLDLLELITQQADYPALFLFTHRPESALRVEAAANAGGQRYEEIVLGALSPEAADEMLRSLLSTTEVPEELSALVREKGDGNPLYLEELVNSLVESGTLIRDEGGWRLAQPLADADVPPTITGIISARLDRLQTETRRVLQEAAVIGRTFSYDVLLSVTELVQYLDGSLRTLEGADLIRAEALEPDLEYIFKHVLTQEVAYGGLLKRERQELHERVGLVMEKLFANRLPDFCESLAYHFSRGRSTGKAIEYLSRSGDKALARYSLEESDSYFRQAFELLQQDAASEQDAEAGLDRDARVIDLVTRWALVYFYRGDFKGLHGLLQSVEPRTESLTDGALGMFYVRLGMTLWARLRFADSREYLVRALKIGERLGDEAVIAGACAWLSTTCAELGEFENALDFGSRAEKLSESGSLEYETCFMSRTGIGLAHVMKGEVKKGRQKGEELVAYGHEHLSPRSQVMGYHVAGLGNFVDGRFEEALDCFQRGWAASTDPFLTWLPRVFVGMSMALGGKAEEAKAALGDSLGFAQALGGEVLHATALNLQGSIYLVTGQLAEGMRVVEEVRQRYLEGKAGWRYLTTTHQLATIYTSMALRDRPKHGTITPGAIGFMFKTMPVARKKALESIAEAIRVAEEIGALGMLGQQYIMLTKLHRRKEPDKAREYARAAVNTLERTECETQLGVARVLLESLEVESA